MAVTDSTCVRRAASARVPTEHGDFELCAYRNNRDDKEHLAFVRGDVANRDAVLARVHSECFTGDVLGSLRCDCGPQLDTALALIAQAGCGVVIYLRQEGRGIGLVEKLKAYNLQDKGYDTVDANLMLGHGADERRYDLAAAILNDLAVRSVRCRRWV
jgi:3,4-dihydroxy 2-butanone 4-phosphate synthase/GTP cyclohydrolase II